MRCKGVVNHLAPDGSTVTAIVCGRRDTKPCVVCHGRAAFLCDFPLTGPRAGDTCSRAICSKHTFRPAPQTDYCPAHAEMHRQCQAGQPT